MALFKRLRAPEQLYAAAMWVVSFVFAGFLIGLGGRIVADLPGAPEASTIDDFVPEGLVATTTRATDSLLAFERITSASLDSALLVREAATSAVNSARTTFEAWIATREATTDPSQDPEVLARTREIDALVAQQRQAESRVETLAAERLALVQARDRLEETLRAAREEAEGPYERARFREELIVFGIRLAITLPLLLIAWWLVHTKRKSEYWPLARGFVLFALFAFFVELVPYLPSYGGYVRYGVGVLVSGAVGVSVIRAMRRYLARRQAEAQRTEAERRRALGHEEALRRMSASLCPGCERPIAKDGAAPTNFCVHCGLRLYEACSNCGVRMNAFFVYCAACGVAHESGREDVPPPRPAAV